MRMSRIAEINLVVILLCSLIWSCSNNYKIETDFYDLLKSCDIRGLIGIRVLAYKYSHYYGIIDGKLKHVERLPPPPEPSHQNPELSYKGYSSLPVNIGYRYLGPQLASPDGNITIASCINKSTPIHPADTFVIIDNNLKKIIYSESFENKTHFTIDGIAWSPKSDIFALLTSTSRIPFQNPLRYFSSHVATTSDYYLVFYRKDGQLLFRKKVITSLIDGSAQLVWIQSAGE